MNWKLKSAFCVGALLVAAQAAAQVTFYEYGARRYYEAPITSVRALTAPAQERCWTEWQPLYRGDDVYSERKVQRCERVASGAPQQWEVTYLFLGLERHAQLNFAPGGRTLTVDENGVPLG